MSFNQQGLLRISKEILCGGYDLHLRLFSNQLEIHTNILTSALSRKKNGFVGDSGVYTTQKDTSPFILHEFSREALPEDFLFTINGADAISSSG